MTKRQTIYLVLQLIALGISIYSLMVSYHNLQEVKKRYAEAQSTQAHLETKFNELSWKLILAQKTNRHLQENGVYTLKK